MLYLKLIYHFSEDKQPILLDTKDCSLVGFATVARQGVVIIIIVVVYALLLEVSSCKALIEVVFVVS